MVGAVFLDFSGIPDGPRTHLLRIVPYFDSPFLSTPLHSCHRFALSVMYATSSLFDLHSGHDSREPRYVRPIMTIIITKTNRIVGQSMVGAVHFATRECHDVRQNEIRAYESLHSVLAFCGVGS